MAKKQALSNLSVDFHLKIADITSKWNICCDFCSHQWNVWNQTPSV